MSITKALLITLHVTLWLGLFYVLAPDPWGLGQFSIPLFRTDHTLPFFTYGVLLNALMIYGYAHIALPNYVKDSSAVYFLGANVLFLGGFVLIESLADFYYMKHTYIYYEYTEDWNSFGAWVTTNFVISGALMLGANFYGFTYDWFLNRARQRELEQEMLRAELMALKHQINPHFLFNILNGLYGLAFKNEDEETAEGIAKLSQMMRYVLYESNDTLVELDKEVAYLQHYIDLQRMRLNPKTEVAFTVQGEVQQQQIAPMVLIPFIENAFKHGVSTVHASTIKIAIQIEGDNLELLVENPIHAASQKPRKTPGGIGLTNVQARLDMLYGESQKLEFGPIGDLYRVQLRLGLKGATLASAK